jgi:hypothetical protein
MHRDLDREAVQQRSNSPGGGMGVGAVELPGLHPVHDHGGNGLLPEQIEAPGDRSQLRLTEGCAPGVDPQRPAGRGGTCRRIEPKHGAQALQRRAAGLARLGQPPQVALRGILEGRREQPVLAREVIEDERRADPENGRDVCDSGARESAAGDFLDSGPQDLFLAHRSVLPPHSIRHGKTLVGLVGQIPLVSGGIS